MYIYFSFLKFSFNLFACLFVFFFAFVSLFNFFYVLFVWLSNFPLSLRFILFFSFLLFLLRSQIYQCLLPSKNHLRTKRTAYFKTEINWSMWLWLPSMQLIEVTLIKKISKSERNILNILANNFLFKKKKKMKMKNCLKLLPYYWLFHYFSKKSRCSIK